MKKKTIQVRTRSRTDLVDITSQVQDAVSNCDSSSGIVVVFVPHTTAGITINENADPDVPRDLAWKINDLIPENEAEYAHAEGNSDSHLKSSLFSPSLTLIFEDGRCVLGTWQAVYFAEFDGPRTHKVHIKIIPDTGGD
ncbi:MAG: secondary thiamine-phosphate synthase enzyme YjbQ [Candidatus Marinimicrobia bacterium]|nr:secondary thiamine-phosphate synthase enzyme YjbQ [Candidatus Neomarinimicrobiota bacterium]